MKVGVIGIGRMGRPIADSLLKAGHSVAVYSRTAARAEELCSMGATVTTSVGEACQADYHSHDTRRRCRSGSRGISVERVSPLLFGKSGKKVFIVGEEPYQANVLKLCGNFLLLSAIEALAESVAFARGQQISPRLLLDIMTDTLFTSPFYKPMVR